jgi:hypothetical protein
LDEQQIYDRARRQVRRIKGFYVHATVYALVNAFLVAINLATSRGGWWSFWPLFGWGIGLIAHGIAVFGFGGLWGPDWEERKIRQIMDKGRPG